MAGKGKEPAPPPSFGWSKKSNSKLPQSGFAQSSSSGSSFSETQGKLSSGSQSGTYGTSSGASSFSRASGNPYGSSLHSTDHVEINAPEALFSETHGNPYSAGQGFQSGYAPGSSIYGLSASQPVSSSFGKKSVYGGSNAAKSYPFQVQPKPCMACAGLKLQLDKERAEVSNLKDLMLGKETGAWQTLKELETLKDHVHGLSGQLANERYAVHTLRREKDDAHRLKTDTERALRLTCEELRKQLREAELNLKSSVESQKELQRLYGQLESNNKGLNRSKTMAGVYENYRRWSEDQYCRPLGMKKYEPWEREMAVNRVNKESSVTTRYGAMYKSELDHKEVRIEIIDNESQQKQQDFNQKVDILNRIRHPNLVSFIATYEKEYALICEDFPQPFSWEERVRICASICSTLLFLHNTKPSPIIHGDLKAQNICFDADNVCRLSVFGLSRSTQNTITNKNNTTLSMQSDICAFGIVLLQMVTGQAEKDLVRKKVLSMGDANQFQAKHIGWQREVLTNKNIVDGRLDNYPTQDVVKMLLLGLRCSHPEESQRPDLATEVWTQIHSMKTGASQSRGRGLFE